MDESFPWLCLKEVVWGGGLPDKSMFICNARSFYDIYTQKLVKIQGMTHLLKIKFRMRIEVKTLINIRKSLCARVCTMFEKRNF